MRKVVLSTLALFLLGGSLLFGATAHAQPAPGDGEMTYAEFEELALSGQLRSGIYIVDGVEYIVEDPFFGDQPFDSFAPLPDDYFDDVPPKFRFLVDPTLPIPPEFQFLVDPSLPVPPEFAFLIDPRLPIPEEFMWLMGPPPGELTQPAVQEATPVPEPTQPAPTATNETPAVESDQEVEIAPAAGTQTDDGEASAGEDASVEESDGAATGQVGSSSEPPVEAELDATEANPADVPTNAVVALQPSVTPPVPTTGGTTDSFLVPLLIFVAVASTALLAAIPVFLRSRSSNDTALRKLALTDDLTKLANRRRLDRDLAGHQQANRPIAVAMIDIDHFKRLNDDFSHSVGDMVLQCVATTIAQNVRASDIAYRYGGEEFCVLLPDATEYEAAAVIDRVRTQIERIDFEYLDRAVTISAGVAVTGSPASGEHGKTTVQRADAALYLAKDAGRNAVMLGSLVPD